MSGHSKWAQIKRQKGIADSKRANVFTRLGKNITLAAKGGGDPTMNFRLRLAIDKAKAANMPKDNIEKAIKRGTGALDGGALEEIIYEGYGPGQVAMLIQTVTDNKNRTVADIKHLFNKYGGNLGGPGSVAWMFSARGVIRPTKSTEAETIELKAIEADAEDVITEEGETIIYTSPTELQRVKDELEQQGVPIDYAEVEMVAKDTVPVPDEHQGQLESLLLALDENDDVNTYYTNAK
ncbi:YebC/PmpR family DNA-binding transcriptional regulator [Candidatus Falkowbacteria bacterium]|nr:YebC/PmpR family DNA-binding transcriptional regulator [Candidatus Falkowbacteria bacterium]